MLSTVVVAGSWVEPAVSRRTSQVPDRAGQPGAEPAVHLLDPLVAGEAGLRGRLAQQQVRPGGVAVEVVVGDQHVPG
ncbi:hypothetical protein Psuf_072800 [Phytohabitans suffuscus]|uniref:Uncharacterized protein n=1 Tax=Phytohabitans suffuscus TaxID=624315 RepID=A0A6F8YUZ8_9ACTN|nr:hypothetical protein Psuf_072800 [Phytohabitans suffuscus]